MVQVDFLGVLIAFTLIAFLIGRLDLTSEYKISFKEILIIFFHLPNRKCFPSKSHDNEK